MRSLLPVGIPGLCQGPRSAVPHASIIFVNQERLIPERCGTLSEPTARTQAYWMIPHSYSMVCVRTP